MYKTLTENSSATPTQAKYTIGKKIYYVGPLKRKASKEKDHDGKIVAYVQNCKVNYDVGLLIYEVRFEDGTYTHCLEKDLADLS